MRCSAPRRSREGRPTSEQERHDRDLLAKLAEHPGYGVLQAYVAAKQEEYYANLARLLAHGARPLDQRAIDYKRGYWDAARLLLQHPAKMLKDLTSELEGDDG